MPTTPNFGLTYPDSGDHVRLWEHFQTLAEDVDTVFARPVFRARRAAAQSIPNAVETALSWDAEDIDTDGGHDLVTNPTRYVFPRAGYYQVSGGCGWVNNATGRRGLFWWKNGAALDGSSAFFLTGVNGTHAVPARAIIVQAAVSDYVELRVFQESGGALNTVTGSSSPSIDIVYIGPA
jgi:hypothetical protein